MKYVILIALILMPTHALAWDGVDSTSGSSVEIGKGNLVRPGEDIEVYDYKTGEYKDVTVEGVRDGLGTVEVEVYDYSKGEYKTYEMDK
jgi:hypothetical protein